MKKIYILGATGSGKSYLAEKISKKFNLPVFCLDDIFWEIKYSKRRDRNEIQILINRILNTQSNWIFEGAQFGLVDNIVKNADEIIWLDIHPWIMAFRILKRYPKRKKEELENYSFSTTLDVIKNVLNSKKEGGSYFKHKMLIEKHEVDVIRISNRRELKDYLKTLE